MSQEGRHPLKAGQSVLELLRRRAEEEAEHPPLSSLRLLHVGELPEGEARSIEAHLAGCAFCRQRFETLQQEARAFLNDHPADQLVRALRQRQRELGGPAAPSSLLARVRASWLRWHGGGAQRLLPLAGAAAAALLLLLAIGPLLLPTDSQPPRPSPPQGPSTGLVTAAGPAGRPQLSTRAKGGVELALLVSRAGGRPRAGVPGGSYHEGDRIQLLATTPDPAHLVVISLDSSGAVTTFFDAEGHAALIDAGTASPLPGSVLLDDARGPERLIGCFCDRPLATEQVLQAGRDALQQAAGRPQLVERLEVPCRQATFLIHKE